MRAILQDILNYTYFTPLFEFLKIYHKKDVITEIVPDLYGKITDIIPETNQLVTTYNDTPWLELGMEVRFAVNPDGSSNALLQAELDPEKYYYVNSIQGDKNCIKFTIGESNLPCNVVDLPFAHFDFTIIHDRSYLVMSDTSWLDPGMRIVFEEIPNQSNAVTTVGLSLSNKYFVYEIIDNNKIRIGQYQYLKNSIQHHFINFKHFTSAHTLKFEIVQDHTFIEGVSPDQVIYLTGRTDEKITKFNGDFGLTSLDKLFYALENTSEYPQDSNINVTNVDQNNEYVSTSLDFINDSDTFLNKHFFIDNNLVPESHPMIDVTGINWNFALEPQANGITRIDYMSKTYNEFLYFDLYTTSTEYRNSNYNALPHFNLELEFGEVNTNFGQVVFETNIGGTYIPLIIYEFKTILDVFAEYSGKIFNVIPTRLHIALGIESQTNIIRTEDTSIFKIGMAVKFKSPPNSSDALIQTTLDKDTTYYIKDIINCESFTISESLNGPTKILPYSNFEFYIIIVANLFEMVEFLPDNPADSNGRELRKHIKSGLKIQFRNPIDSTNAVLEAGLDLETEYYVKDIIKCIEGVERYIITGIDNNNNLTIDSMDLLYPDVEIQFSNPGDSALALTEATLSDNTIYYVKEVFNNSFTISATRGGATLNLPYSNFQFVALINVARTEFTISETENGEMLPVKHSDFKFDVYHKVNELNVDDTRWFRVGMPIKFETHNDLNAVSGAGLEENTRYYIKEIVNENRLKISETIDGPIIDLDDIFLQFFIKHDTGNGIIFTSYPKINLPGNGMDPEIYTRTTEYNTDLEIIPNEDPYDFRFGKINPTFPEESSVFGPYYNDINDYIFGRTPPALPTPPSSSNPIITTYEDQNLVRAFDQKRPINPIDLDGKFVYTFEVSHSVIDEIVSSSEDPLLTGKGSEVNIYNNTTNGYILPTGFLEKRWTYHLPQILAILSQSGDKIMRISDEGKLMITIKSSLCSFNYVLNGTDNTQ